MPIPLSVEVIVIVPCLLCRGCISWKEELCTPSCICQVLNGDSLCRKSCVDAIVEILLYEGGDVELGARTSKPVSYTHLTLPTKRIV